MAQIERAGLLNVDVNGWQGDNRFPHSARCRIGGAEQFLGQLEAIEHLEQ